MDHDELREQLAQCRDLLHKVTTELVARYLSDPDLTLAHDVYTFLLNGRDEMGEQLVFAYDVDMRHALAELKADLDNCLYLFSTAPQRAQATPEGVSEIIKSLTAMHAMLRAIFPPVLWELDNGL